MPLASSVSITYVLPMRLLHAPRWLVFLTAVLLIAARPAFATDTSNASELKFALILTRHGVRSPLASQTQALEKFAAEAWPKWEVPAGYLTPHGKEQMTLMGRYYRERFVSERLLTGDAERDAAHVYFRSDSDQRTIETARGLSAALLPGMTIDPHARPEEKVDPLFRPVSVPVGPLDRQLAIASVLGRIGGDPANVVLGNRAAFLALQQVLVGESGRVPAGKTPVLELPSEVGPGKRDHSVNFDGSLQVAESIVDVLLLEYGDGMPLDQVGWGRVTRERLTQLLTLHSLFFELAQASSYPARAQGSNLASHILASLEQAATGKADPQAFGTPDQKLVVVVGHDTNIANLGGLFGLNWWLPETARNPVLPGGAMLFELRERLRDHQLLVYVSYVAQSFDQMRNLTPLTLTAPPAVAQIFVPGASDADSGYGAPLTKFAAMARRAIDPAFVVADPN